MSFNFSDDDDDDDLNLDAFDDTGLLALAFRERAHNSTTTTATTATSAASTANAAAAASASASPAADASEEAGEFEEDSEGGDWGNIDWEDADDQDDEDEDEDDRTRRTQSDENNNLKGDDFVSSVPTQGIMINFGKTTAEVDNAKEEESKPAKKRKRRATRVLRNVPYETEQMVLNVRRSQMLCYVVHCMQCSFACGVDDTDERSLLSHVALSLIPQKFHQRDKDTKKASMKSKQSFSSLPTNKQLKEFSHWFFEFVNRAGERRRAALRRNVAQGASATRSPSPRRRGRRQSGSTKKSKMKQGQGAKKHEISTNTPIAEEYPTNLIQTLMHLSPYYDEDPQLFLEEEGIDAIDAVENISSQDKALLFLVMVRILGWRARHVTSLNPMSLELTVDHPLLASATTTKSHPLSASLGVKPPANKSSIGNNDNMLQKLLRLMHEGGMLDQIHATRCGRKRKKQKHDANTTGNDTIELLSSGDEDGEIGKIDSSRKTPSSENTPHNNSARYPEHVSLSWVEVLCHNEASNKQSKSPLAAMWVPIQPAQESFGKPEEVESILGWMQMTRRINSVTEESGKMTSSNTKPPKSLKQRHANKYAKKSPVSYVLAVEHPPLKFGAGNSSNISTNKLQGVRFTDVTPRYANTWSRTLRLRGATGKEITAGGGKCVDEWWENSLKQINGHCRPKQRQGKSLAKSPVRSVTRAKTKTGQEVDVVELESSDDDKKCAHSDGSESDEHESVEAKELSGNRANETIPTSKAAFKQNPFYVIPSVLNSQDVLHPDARKRICGVFKGELVYRRSDVSKALRAKKWLYQGRKVKENELDKPVKQIKARKKPAATSKGFQALSSYGVSEEAQDELITSINKTKGGEENEMDDLYGAWQTDPWSPPHIGPTDSIPTNDFRNVELALINPGLTHMDQPRLASIAKKLGIPYAPCMLGYEHHRGGIGTPTIRGIVVHDHNVALLREAHVEWESHAVEREHEERRKEILKRWKRLVVGIMTKERLDREYG
ncbi:hypothetical protein ACHAXR_008231 [Thalassiosira sp. AJA248-18]